jgi:hypothetical protein
MFTMWLRHTYISFNLYKFIFGVICCEISWFWYNHVLMNQCVYLFIMKDYNFFAKLFFHKKKLLNEIFFNMLLQIFIFSQYITCFVLIIFE